MTRNPQQDPGAERAILGAILLNARAIDTANEAGLTPDDFAQPGHQVLFACFGALASEDKGIDFVTVSTWLTDHGQLDAVGGVPYLAGLTGASPMLANLPTYIETVREKSLTRGVLRATAGIGEGVHAGEVSGEAALEQAESALQVLRADSVTSKSGEEIGPIAERVYAEMQRRERDGGGEPGISTGFTLIDKMLGGLRAGHLDIVAGRPGSGKSSWAFNVAAEAAIRGGLHVVAFSLEMPRDDLAARMLCSEARVSSERMRDAKMRHDDWRPLLAATELVQDVGLYIDDKPAITVAYLRSVLRRRAAMRPVDLVIVDYLQLMRGDKEDRRQGRQVEVSGISGALKGAAKEFGVPVLALAQLNRKCEERTDRRPLMSDLRESGAIEQDADSVSFLYRGEVYEPENQELKGLAEFIVRKNRHGAVGTVNLAWRGEFTRFENLEADEQPQRRAQQPAPDEGHPNDERWGWAG